jgi:hypothetical protein
MTPFQTTDEKIAILKLEEARECYDSWAQNGTGETDPCNARGYGNSAIAGVATRVVCIAAQFAGSNLDSLNWVSMPEQTDPFTGAWRFNPQLSKLSTQSPRYWIQEILSNFDEVEAEMRELQLLVSKSEVCVVDAEASDKDPRSALLFGVAFSVKAGEAFYVPLTEADLEGTSPEAMKACLRRVFAGRARFIGHNLKFDCVLLRRYGITIRHPLFDTMLASSTSRLDPRVRSHLVDLLRIQ